MIYRLIKSGTRVLLIGWTPAPVATLDDLEFRLHAVEQLTWKLDKRAQRAAAAGNGGGGQPEDPPEIQARARATVIANLQNGDPWPFPLQ